MVRDRNYDEDDVMRNIIAIWYRDPQITPVFSLKREVEGDRKVHKNHQGRRWGDSPCNWRRSYLSIGPLDPVPPDTSVVGEDDVLEMCRRSFFGYRFLPSWSRRCEKVEALNTIMPCRPENLDVSSVMTGLVSTYLREMQKTSPIEGSPHFQ